MSEEKFKKCGCCQAVLSMKEIVNDPNIRPIGMAFADDTTEGAYYFFQHEIPGCGTSFVLLVENLKSFIDETIPEQKLTLGPCCEQHCVDLKDLGECKQECHFAPFRRFLLKMIAIKREAAVQASVTKP